MLSAASRRSKYQRAVLYVNQEGGTSTWQPTRLIEPGEAEVKTLQDASLVPGSHHVNIYNIENISELGNNR